MIISSFGLHEAAGIPFLVQGSGAQNLISPDLRSPFQLHITPKRTRCPHQVDLASYVEAPDWVSDPLAQAFLPVPGCGAQIVRGHEDLITPLQRLSSATGPLAWPIWGRKPHELRYLYALTNLSPIVLLGAEVRHTAVVVEHINYAQTYGRRLLVFARQGIPLSAGVDWIDTDLTPAVAGEPLEAIGSGVLRRVMHAGCS